MTDSDEFESFCRKADFSELVDRAFEGFIKRVAKEGRLKHTVVDGKIVIDLKDFLALVGSIKRGPRDTWEYEALEAIFQTKAQRTPES